MYRYTYLQSRPWALCTFCVPLLLNSVSWSSPESNYVYTPHVHIRDITNDRWSARSILLLSLDQADRGTRLGTQEQKDTNSQMTGGGG